MREYIEFTLDPNPVEIDGWFDEDDGRIYIRAGLDRFVKLLIYAHENQHKKCFDSKCKCWKEKSDLLCEYHAFRAEFRFMCEGRFVCQVWKQYFANVQRELRKYRRLMKTTWKKGGREHFQALKRLCKTKKFQEYAKYAGWLQKISCLIKK